MASTVTELMRRRFGGKKEGDPYPELIKNKGWTGTGEVFSAPNDCEGYCVTPFYPVDVVSPNRHSLTVKAGYVSGVDIPRGTDVFKITMNASNTSGAWTHNTDPKTISASSSYHAFSATLKMSELDNCYIYDNNTGVYLFKGKNV